MGYWRRAINRGVAAGEEDLIDNESAVSRAVSEALAALGFKVYSFASYRALPPTARGFADIVALRPHCPVLFLQIKREEGGVLSQAQREFAEACCAAEGAAYGTITTIGDLIDLLRRIGVVGGGA